MKPYFLLAVFTVHLLEESAGSLLDPPGAHYHAELVGNYEPPQSQEREGEEEVRGPGEGGAPVILDGVSPNLSKYGMAMEVSDMIALDRSVPDLRTPGCR